MKLIKIYSLETFRTEPNITIHVSAVAHVSVTFMDSSIYVLCMYFIIMRVTFLLIFLKTLVLKQKKTIFYLLKINIFWHIKITGLIYFAGTNSKPIQI